MVSYSIQNFDVNTAEKFIIELMPLAQTHYQQTVKRPFAPDVEVLGRAWESGSLKIIIARDGHVLVGYQVWSLGSSLFENSSNANLMGIYLDDKHRNQGKDFLDFAMNVLKAISPNTTFSTIASDKAHQRWLEMSGWKEQSREYNYG